MAKRKIEDTEDALESEVEAGEAEFERTWARLRAGYQGADAIKVTELMAPCEAAQARIKAARAMSLRTAESIIVEVCREFHWSRAAIMGASRQAPLVHVRRILWARLMQAGYTQSAVGRLCGRDASTVNYAVNKCRNASLSAE